MNDQKPSMTDNVGEPRVQPDAEEGFEVPADEKESVDWLQDPPLGYRFIKRFVDIVASAFALVLLLPVFLAVGMAIKLTSKGPILSRQTRLGRHGVPFEYLKFRTMFANYNAERHRSYVEQLLSGKFGAVGEKPVFKIQHDPRISPVGRFLRRTSLDELPQFWNVLRGDMTLVGPRPPVSYEWDCYESWHKQRLSATPGITGLWQIEGRSITGFDDMVKLDIEYIKHASLLVDLKILLKTPVAALRSDKAF